MKKMKLRLRYAFLAVALLFPLVLLTPVIAQEDDSTTNTDTQTETTTESSQDKKRNSTEFKDRVEKRKAERQAKLDKAAETRIKARCKASQGIVTSLHNRLKNVNTARSKVYDKVVDRLTEITSKLETAGLTTTALEDQLTTLKSKIATYKADFAKYLQAVDDLKTIDCEADPEAFKASLEDARTLLEQVRKDAKDIRAYLTETIKPTLVDLRQQLEAQNQT